MLQPAGRPRMIPVLTPQVFGRDFPVFVHADECKLEKATKTAELLAILSVKYPEVDFSFVLGSDLCDGIPKYVSTTLSPPPPPPLTHFRFFFGWSTRMH